MSFFKRLLGGQKEPSRGQIVEAVLAFVDAESWTESKQIVKTRRDKLLTDAADRVFATLLEQAEDDARVTRVLQEHRALLARCRREGIEAAFADHLRPSAMPGNLQQVIEAVQAFVTAQTWAERKQIVETHREQLLSDTADRFFASALELNKDDANAVWSLQRHQALLAHCRREGIEAAFADYLRPQVVPKNPQQITEAVRAFGFAQTWAERKQIVEAHRNELLSDAADQIFANLLELEEVKGDANATRLLQEQQAFLARCRREGIEAVFADHLRPPAMPDNLQQVSEAVQAFVAAQTWAERKQIVEAQRDQLLSDTADRAFDFLLELAKGDANATHIFQEHQALLARCRHEGIGAAFADYLRPRAVPDNADQITEAVQAFVNAQSWAECKQIIEVRRDELLTKAADQIFATSLERYRDDANASRLLEERRALLARCRREGIETVFADYPANHVSVEQSDLLEEMQRLNPNDMGELGALVQEIWSEEMQNLDPRNLRRRVEACRTALALIDRDEQPKLWAILQATLGNSLAESPLDDRAANLEQAIDAYQQALQVRTRQAMPVEWAETINDLAIAYQRRIRGERRDNLEQAITACEQALQVRTRGDMPVEWAQTMNVLAAAYIYRIWGDRANNLEQAITAFKQALEVTTKQSFPEAWARTQNNLAATYADRIKGERAENLEAAIRHCQQALEVRTRQSFPEAWAATQNNLAYAYLNRVKGERAENLEAAIRHCQQALEVRTRQAFPEDWAATQNNLALAYRDRIKGERAENLEVAIRHLQQALEVHTRQAFPEAWARTQNSLAATYADRIKGERAKNIEAAINHYQQALEVRTRQAFPEDWAATQNNLALAYRDRIKGERAENLERAVEYYQQALKVYTRQTFPEAWAMTQNSLALAYLNRIKGERAENLEQVIFHCQQALKVYTRQAFPEDWAGTQNNLANAFSERIVGERAENLERAIEHCQQALKVYTREAFTEQWVTIQFNLAEDYSNRIKGERAENLERAIFRFQQVLEVRTREAFPEDWAATQNNLATAYGRRIKGERAENIEAAIHHYQQALEVRTREAFPEDWAATQNNLAQAYRNRIKGERAENLEQALVHCQQALEVSTRQVFPQQWAATQDTLAAAYSDRIKGERAENLEQAIFHFQQALKVYTRQAFPEDWAGTQNNLANAFSERIVGERTENLERAIEHCQQALQVFTRQAFPERWAMTQHNLAAAYSDRIKGERAENLERAIEHYQQALKVYTRQAFPEDWAGTQNNLALAYRGRIKGERAANLEQAIFHCQQALKVYTCQAFPEDWAGTQYNLALAYSDRIKGERAENIEQALVHFQQALTVRTLERFPANYQQTQRNLGHLHYNEHNWAAAQAAYARAIEAGQTLLAAAYTGAGRQAEVGETSRLYARAAYCLLQLDQPGQALHQLEQGKTRLLAEALALAEADLAMLSETQQQAVQAARERVRLLEAEMRLPPDTPARRDDRELAEALGQARADLNHLIETIRAEEPNFMPTGLDLPGILALIPAGGALVAPLVTSQGSAVFVLPHGTTTVKAEHVIRLDDFTDDDLNALLVGSADKPGWLWLYTRDMRQWQTTIETFTGRLWDELMGPVHENLTALGLAQGAPVLLMPQGGLGLLPLHAAWREVTGQTPPPRGGTEGGRSYFLDDYTVSYAPSAYALSVGRRRLREDEDRHGRKLLAVINPTGDLLFTPAEGEAVARLFGSAVQLVEAEATPEVVVQAARGQTYFHFSGHGYYRWSDAMQSGLVLANKTRLTLSEIIAKLDLSSARLVTLSACETGMTDISQSPDEYIGLPAGFLQAGAPTVLSTLWAVADLSTALLMERFYRNHLDGKMDLAAALREAQLWLRDLPVKEVARYADQCYRQSKRTKDAKELLKFKKHYDYLAGNEPTTCPFAQPYYWAAFTLSGIAEPDEIVTK